MNVKRYITNAECWVAARAIHLSFGGKKQAVYGIPRGGIPVAYMFAAFGHDLAESPDEATIIVDDILDTGTTMLRYAEHHPDKLYVTLFGRKDSHQAHELGSRLRVGSYADGEWLVFPWENNTETQEVEGVEDNIRRILQYIGEDPTREGLRDTPGRVVKAYGEWFGGYGQDASAFFKTFEDGAENYDEMILNRNIPFYSFCEHHMAPFFGVAHVAYIPKDGDGMKIIGLSKMTRIVEVFARRLQVQERLTREIADAMVEGLDPLGVAVVTKARHLCMESRGIKKQGEDTIMSAMRGVFRDRPEVRTEFFGLINGK